MVCQLLFYTLPSGRAPVRDWLARLRDARGRAAVHLRLQALEAGLPVDERRLDGGLFEVRIHVGPGYRLYCHRPDTRPGEVVVLLLAAGQKGSQRRDIALARRRLDAWIRMNLA